MRKIKFRGMDVNGSWYFGNISILTKDVQHVRKGHYISNRVGMPFAYQVRPETVGQFTGLKDKNGTDVYDGDIYRNLDSGLIGKLTIVDGVGGLYVLCTEYKDGRMYNNLPFAEHDTTNFEVIGNIYDNPELLNKDGENNA